MSEFAKALGDIAAGYAVIAAAFENLSNAVKQDMKAQAADAAKAEKAKAKAAKTAPKEVVETEAQPDETHAAEVEEARKRAVDVNEPMKLEIVRACLAELSQKGLTKEVKDLLKKYGANKLSAIKQEDYVALMKDAEALANNAA